MAQPFVTGPHHVAEVGLKPVMQLRRTLKLGSSLLYPTSPSAGSMGHYDRPIQFSKWPPTRLTADIQGQPTIQTNINAREDRRLRGWRVNPKDVYHTFCGFSEVHVGAA